jgi:hypothetical protein
LPVRCVIPGKPGAMCVAAVGGAKFLEDVIHVGEGEVGRLVLLPFAVGVEFLCVSESNMQ